MTLREKLRRAMVAHARRFPELHGKKYTLGGDHHLASALDPRSMECARYFDGGLIPYKPSVSQPQTD